MRIKAVINTLQPLKVATETYRGSHRPTGADARAVVSLLYTVTIMSVEYHEVNRFADEVMSTAVWVDSAS